MNFKIVALIAALVLALSGYGLIWYHSSFWVALGVFIVMFCQTYTPNKRDDTVSIIDRISKGDK